MIGRLRVAVPRALLERDAHSLDGRMWRQTLRELDRKVRLRAAEDHPRADVWLSNALVNRAALVVQVHEAPWDDPLIEPAYAALMAERTEAAAQAAARVVTASGHGARQIRERHTPRALDIVPLGVDHDCFRPRGSTRQRSVLFVGTVHPQEPRRAAGGGGPARRAARARPLSRRRSGGLGSAAGGGGRRGDGPPRARRRGPGGADGSERRPVRSLAVGGLRAAGAGGDGVRDAGGGQARGPLPEVVGDAGLLVEPTPDALAAGLARALDDHALGARGLQRASEFTWARTAAGWLAALEAAR